MRLPRRNCVAPRNDRFAICRSIVVILISALYPLCLHAQEHHDQDTIVTAVVSAERHRAKIIPSQILEGEKLERLNAYSVADAVRYFSGVQIKDYGGVGGLKTVNVRSLGSHHVGVFYDGIEIGNAQNGVVDLGRFSLDNMEAVSIFNGQKSAIFQTAKDFASSSSFYMTARRPRFMREGKRNNLNFGFKGGSFDTYNPSILWEHKFSDKVTSSLSAEYLYTSGKYKFSYSKKNGYDTTEVRKNGDVHLMRVEGTLFGRLNDGDWNLKAYFYDSERGYPGAAVREEPGKFSHQDRQWDDSFFLQGSLQKAFTSWYNFQLRGKYAWDYLHYLSDPRLDVTTMYVDNKYWQSEGYLSTAHLFTITPWWSASLAGDLQYNTMTSDMQAFVYPRRLALYTAAATSFVWPRLKVQGSLLHTYVVDATRIESAAAGLKSKLSPSIVASFRAIDGLTLRAFYKNVFRMPTFNDLYYTFVGNKDLEPEQTAQYDFGGVYEKEWGRGVLRRLELTADGYFNQVKNKIVAMPTSNQFRWTMLNLGYVEIRGVDIAAELGWRPIADINVSTRINYTYQLAQDKTDRQSEWYGGQIPYVPWHSGSAVVSGSWKRLGFNYSFIYTGERFEAVANIPENHDQPWYTHDASLSYSFPMQGYELRVAGELNNIFNQQYEVVQCYPMPGTNFKLKFNVIL